MTSPPVNKCKDPYRILKIRRKATLYEIDRAAGLQNFANADGLLFPDGLAAHRLKDIEWARTLLSDPLGRAAFDEAWIKMFAVEPGNDGMVPVLRRCVGHAGLRMARPCR